MERKWYLDLWLLVTSPFKRGIPEIVEFGTIQRGFAATVAMIVITLVFSVITDLLLAYVFDVHIDKLGSVMGQFAGLGLMSLTLGMIAMFAVLAIYSVILSQVANKFGAHTNYESVLKICWYQSAYSMVISLVISIVQVILVLIVNGLNLDVYAPDMILYIIGFSYRIFQVVAYLWCFWVSLTLMARQIEKGRLATFGIGILASLIPVVFIGILVGMVMLATSR